MSLGGVRLALDTIETRLEQAAAQDLLPEPGPALLLELDPAR